MTRNGHLWNTNAYFEKNNVSKNSSLIHFSNFRGNEVSYCDMSYDTAYRSGKSTPMFIMNLLLAYSKSKP
jgi:hypothetical protein